MPIVRTLKIDLNCNQASLVSRGSQAATMADDDNAKDNSQVLRIYNTMDANLLQQDLELLSQVKC